MGINSNTPYEGTGNPEGLKYQLGGYDLQIKKGSVSRVVFYHEEIKHNIKLHKPHQGHVLKKYQIDMIIQELKSNGLL